MYHEVGLLNLEFPRNNEKSIDKTSTKTKLHFNPIHRLHNGQEGTNYTHQANTHTDVANTKKKEKKRKT